MSVAPETTVALQNRFFRELPEMAIRWRAETFPELQLLERAGHTIDYVLANVSKLTQVVPNA